MEKLADCLWSKIIKNQHISFSFFDLFLDHHDQIIFIFDGWQSFLSHVEGSVHNIRIINHWFCYIISRTITKLLAWDCLFACILSVAYIGKLRLFSWWLTIPTNIFTHISLHIFSIEIFGNQILSLFIIILEQIFPYLSISIECSFYNIRFFLLFVSIDNKSWLLLFHIFIQHSFYHILEFYQILASSR